MLEARRLLGAKEIPGPVTAPFISKMLHRLGAWWTDDETPWCATFVSWCLQEVQVIPPKAFYRAAAFCKWGLRISPDIRPANYGTVVVIERNGGNHVGFLTGIDRVAGKVQLLGGNQGNRVMFAPFDMTRIVAAVYPGGPGTGWNPGANIMGIPCPPWLYKPTTTPVLS